MAYSRVYHSIVDDPRFLTIYPNDAALAAWLRLLMTADATFPAPAPLPRMLRQTALAALCDAGIIELVGATHYRVHGLASERDKRSQSARNAAAVRWQSEPHASKDEHRQDKTSTTRASANGRLEPVKDVLEGESFKDKVRWRA